MRRVILIFTIIFFAWGANQAYPYWIWSPKTSKWVNPKYAVKPTPAEQLAYAQSIYKQKKYKEAIREFQRLIQYYPKSAEAAEAQYYLGLCVEAQDNLYEAYLAFQKVIDRYPFSERIQEIIEKEFKIAESFMAGKTRKALGINLPVDNPAIEIFRKVVENSTYGPLASAAQYKLGLVLKGAGRFIEAEEEFQKVISNYPKSEWVAAPITFNPSVTNINIKDININVSTDLSNILFGTNASSGSLLLMRVITFGAQKRIDFEESTKIAGNYYLNTSLGWYHILANYCDLFAEALTGTLNGSAKTFDHVKEFLKQEKIRFHPIAAIDWKKPFTLAGGKGWLTGAEYEPETGMCEINVGFNPYE